MRPIIIGIGGAHSGAGKTNIACQILEKSTGWGAIKYTKTSLYCSIIEDTKIISEEGKDTKKLLDSGAEKVLWVQASYDNLTDTLQIAIESLSYLKGIVIEGNSPIEILKPDIVVFVYGGKGELKKGAEKILEIADVVVFDKEPPAETPKKAKSFRKDDIKKCIDYVIKLIKKYGDRG
jgi:uridine kinase